MATTYDFVAANKRRSLILIVVFVLIIGLVGYAFSRLLNGGPVGVVTAIIVAVLMSLGGYYGGDRIALATAGAQGPITKTDNAYLFNLVENLCIAAGMPIPKIYLISDQQINAFATGRDPQHASIAVTIGAIKLLENEELEGVLAHELSHIKNYDVRYMTLVVILVGVITLLSDFFWRARWMGGQRRDNNNSGNQLTAIFMIIGLVLLILAPLIGQLIQLAVSRKREFLADASGALLTRYPEGLARALEKIGSTSTAPLVYANKSIAHLYISSPFGPHAGGA
ncbi:MAG: M48 family metallopeptidase, partial [Candidatus Kerfeldbacteria bacterium]|nr:M48 family metallopeptidase [Candidatus Kerfeldbacteria bacterium]